MTPKSGHRFSDQVMRQKKARAIMKAGAISAAMMGGAWPPPNKA
jgi:hypothetical protein